MKTEQIYMTLPFYGKKLKAEGIPTEDLQIVKHFHIPSEKDFTLISDFIKDCDTVVDIGAGYGLIIKSLAKIFPHKKFLGIDTIYWQGNKFPVPKKTHNLRFEFNGIQAMAYADKYNRKVPKFDAVLCCWMPQGDDWREMIAKISNKKIILILSSDFVTGTTSTYAGLEEFGFKFKKAWRTEPSLIQLWEKNE